MSIPVDQDRVSGVRQSNPAEWGQPKAIKKSITYQGKVTPPFSALMARREAPDKSIRYAEWTSLSKIASAIVES